MLTFYFLDSQWDDLFLHKVGIASKTKALLTDDVWNLYSTCEQDFKPLCNGGFLSILEEVFHQALEFRFEELLETLSEAKLLISVGKQSDVDYSEKVLGSLDGWRSYHYDEVLFGFGSELEGNPFRELTSHGILDVPSLVLHFTVAD